MKFFWILLFFVGLEAKTIPTSFVGTWTGGPAGGFHLLADGTFTGEGILDQMSGTYSVKGKTIHIHVKKGVEFSPHKRMKLIYYPFNSKSTKNRKILTSEEKEMYHWQKSTGYLIDQDKIKYFKQ